MKILMATMGLDIGGAGTPIVGAGKGEKDQGPHNPILPPRHRGENFIRAVQPYLLPHGGGKFPERPAMGGNEVVVFHQIGPHDALPGHDREGVQEFLIYAVGKPFPFQQPRFPQQQGCGRYCGNHQSAVPPELL